MSNDFTDAEISAQLRSFIIDEIGAESDFEDSDLLFEEGLLDSLGLLELVRFIEDTFGCEISDLDVTLAHFGSIKSMVLFVNKLLEG